LSLQAEAWCVLLEISLPQNSEFVKGIGGINFHKTLVSWG